MKSKTFLGLLALCLALGGITYWMYGRPDAPETDGAGRMGEKLFADLSVNDIAAIDIAGPESSVRLEKGETVWVVTERHGYPADFSKMADFVRKITGVSVGRGFTADEAVLARTGLVKPDAQKGATEEKGTRVIFKNAEGKPLADILIGKEREGAGSGGHYLKPTDGDTVYLVDASFRFVDTEPGQWIVKELLEVAAPSVEKVTYGPPEGDAAIFAIARPTKDAKPEFIKRPAGFEDAKAVENKINTLFGALSAFQIEDVADPAGDAGEKGFGDNAFTFHLYDGTYYTVYPGEKAPEDKGYFVKVRAGYRPPAAEPEKAPESTAPDETAAAAASDGPSGDPAADALAAAEAEKEKAEKEKAAAEKRKKEAELAGGAEALDKKMRDWVYIIPDWRHDKFAADPAALLEKPEPPSPPEVNPPE